jgi:peptidyl-prolyl cis-trans isomerase D
MAVLEKIRVKFGLAASIIIAIGLLSFIVDPSEIISAVQNMSSKYDVGEINGKSISYTDFQSEVENMTTINEMTTGNTAQGSEAQQQIRNAVWQDLVYRNLFLKKAQAAGIRVGEAEIVDLTTGNDLSPLIAQNPVFLDENGQFSRSLLSDFIHNVNSDQSGNLRLYWNYLQNSIASSQYSQKYYSLFTAASLPNSLQVSNEIAENNTTADAEFVMIPFGYQPDSTLSVSDSEIKAYYNAHKKFYKQQANRDMEYVVYEVVPSEKDINDMKETVAGLYEEFATTDNMKAFLLKNSDRAYSEYWYKKGELSTVYSGIDNFVWEGNSAVSDIMTSRNNFYVARVLDTKMIPDSAYVKHILLQGTNAKSEADSLVNVIKKGENISNLAATYSLDKGSMADGELGAIGWMTQSYLIPGFESVITAKVGEPYVIDTQYGTHVVLVTKKSKPVEKKQVAILEKDVLASKETFNDYYAKANTFATMAAGGYDNYKKAVDSLKVYSHPVNGMLESSDKLGAIDNTKEVTRWVYENKAGKVSPILTIDNNYFFIATVKNIHKEGYASVNEVASTIRQSLLMKKQGEKKQAEVKELIAGLTDMEAIANKLGSTVSTQSGIAFSSINSQGLDPAFIGAVSVAPEGKVCGPVLGSIGVYVFKVTSRDTGSYYTEDDAKARDARYASYNSQLILPVMMDDAEVKDNRARFY